MTNNYSKDRLLIKSKQLFILLGILLFVGCSYTKENYLNDFSSFIEEVKVSSSSYSEADWAEIDKQYDEYAVEKYKKFKSELTPEEMLTISKLKGTYAALKIRKGAGELFDQAIQMINQTKDVLDSTVETINK